MWSTPHTNLNFLLNPFGYSMPTNAFTEFMLFWPRNTHQQHHPHTQTQPIRMRTNLSRYFLYCPNTQWTRNNKQQLLRKLFSAKIYSKLMFNFFAVLCFANIEWIASSFDCNYNSTFPRQIVILLKDFPFHPLLIHPVPSTASV